MSSKFEFDLTHSQDVRRGQSVNRELARAGKIQPGLVMLDEFPAARETHYERILKMRKTEGPHVRVWEFRVRPRFRKKFERIYGPGGKWLQLFKKGKGFLRTELFRDQETRGRYLTVDYWESEKAYDAFRSEFAQEFTILDCQCESLTEKETFLGSFSILARQRPTK